MGSHEETVDGDRRDLLRPVRSSLTMSVVSPGRLLLIFLVISEPLISNSVANEQTSGENDKSVVIEILDVSQPYNCSAFFDDLEELLTETAKHATRINKEQTELSMFVV